MTLDTVSFTVTAPGASPGSAMAAVSGDSAIIRNGTEKSSIFGLAMWTNGQVTNGVTQMVWPSGHDLVRGLRYPNIVLQPDNKVPLGLPLRFRAQDPLTVTQIGSATAGDIETVTLLVLYEDLPGTDSHLVNLATVRKRGVTSLTIQDTVTPTAGAVYSGARALNAASDLLKANTDYAILGGVTGANGGAITLRGVDTANLRVSMPCLSADSNWTANWFAALSEAHGVNCIPVINSANRAGIFTELLTNELTTAVPFCWNLVELDK